MQRVGKKKVKEKYHVPAIEWKSFNNNFWIHWNFQHSQLSHLNIPVWKSQNWSCQEGVYSEEGGSGSSLNVKSLTNYYKNMSTCIGVAFPDMSIKHIAQFMLDRIPNQHQWLTLPMANSSRFKQRISHSFSSKKKQQHVHCIWFSSDPLDYPKRKFPVLLKSISIHFTTWNTQHICQTHKLSDTSDLNRGLKHHQLISSKTH